jgi:hypothetical protein
MRKCYLEPEQQAAVALFSRNIQGPVVMLNLLRFREIADYSADPELAPPAPVSGRQAFQKYIEHTQPLLHARSGEILFLGNGGHFFIGPPDEQWDLVMLIKQNSLADFLAFASDTAYLAGIGDRSAALSDARLLPLLECGGDNIESREF